MIGIFIAGLAFGLLMGCLIMRQHMEKKVDELWDLLEEQNEVVILQKRYIEQEDRRMELKERARMYERHCHLCNRFEMMTSNGLMVVKIFDDNGKAVRVTYKDGEPVDIQKANPELLRPIKSNTVEFGGF